MSCQFQVRSIASNSCLDLSCMVRLTVCFVWLSSLGCVCLQPSVFVCLAWRLPVLSRASDTPLSYWSYDLPTKPCRRHITCTKIIRYPCDNTIAHSTLRYARSSFPINPYDNTMIAPNYYTPLRPFFLFSHRISLKVLAKLPISPI